MAAPKKTTGRLSALRERAAAKATPQAPAPAPAGERAKKAPAKKKVSAPVQRAAVPSGAVSLARVSVPEAVETQRKHLAAVGRLEYFIDFTDADGGYASRVRTSIHVAPEAIDAMNALQIDEVARFGKAPKIYHYVELALLKFMPTADEASAAVGVEVPIYEAISTVVSVPAKQAMRSTRKVRNTATGYAVVKHWFYTQAVLRMVAARRAALGL